MKLPEQDEKLTQEQVNLAVNLDSFPDSTPGDKGWHEGLFEPWALSFGYPEGKPMYASVNPGGYHIYFLNDKHQAPIILKKGETPSTYGIEPE